MSIIPAKAESPVHNPRVDKDIKTVTDLVSTWTKKYLHKTKFLETVDNNVNKYVTEFGLPTPTLPVPVASVRCYFFIDPQGKIEFRFENDSLRHKIDHTVRGTVMENWIERYLHNKKLTSNILFLGTEFEATRIKNERIDKYTRNEPEPEEKKEIPEILPEFQKPVTEVDIFTNAYFKSETSIHQMRKTLFDVFRAVDVADLGIVSYDECKEIFVKGFNLILDDEEMDALLKKADKDKDGLIRYESLVPVASEMLMGVLIKGQAEKFLRDQEKEFEEVVLMIQDNDKIFDLRKTLQDECAALDEDKLRYITPDQLETVLKAHEDIMAAEERVQFMEHISKTAPKFQYARLWTYLCDFRQEILRKSLRTNTLNKVDVYLLNLLKKSDQHDKGTLPLEAFKQAIKSSDSIKLTTNQIQLLSSYAPKAENGEIDYKKHIRLISEMVQRFFDESLNKKKELFLQKGHVTATERMTGWSDEELRKEQDILFVLADEDKDGFLNDTEYLKLMKQVIQAQLSDKELLDMMASADKDKDSKLSRAEYDEHFPTLLKIARQVKANNDLATSK